MLVTIQNKRGLHARAAAKFVKTVTSFDAEVLVKRTTPTSPDDSGPVTGSSILGLMMLGADPGTELEITATGPQADDVLAELKELINHKFGEDA